MTGGDDLPQDLRDFCFSSAGKSLGRSRWVESDAKKSLDGAAGTQRRQEVA